jgi:diaminopimelate decarboxylase
MPQLKPLLHPKVRDVIRDTGLLFRAADLHAGPVHIIVPEVMDDSIARFRNTFSELGVDTHIYFAHKATRSPALVKQAQYNGINIDVASVNELVSALANGFTGTRISCTGAKNDTFLTLAIQHGCIISLDSVEELDRILKLRAVIRNASPTSLLVRVNDLRTKDRDIQLKRSRFGIAKKDLPAVLERIKGAKDGLRFRGFHYHHDGYDSETKAGFLEDMLSLTEQAFRNGLTPDSIDIGGVYKTKLIEDYTAWGEYVERLCSRVLEGLDPEVWGTSPYGLHLNEKGRLSGKEKLQSLAGKDDYVPFVQDVFLNETLRERPLNSLIAEAMLRIIIEPGNALVYNCGFTLVRVIGVKHDPSGDAIVLTDANIFNLSSKMFDPLTDPFLIRAPGSAPEEAEFPAYVAGNLCREDDMLLRRRVSFPAMPKPGDLLCFANTAAYSSDFEDAHAIQQPTGKKWVVTGSPGIFALCAEEVYHPVLRASRLQTYQHL